VAGQPILLGGVGCCYPRAVSVFDGLPGGSFAPRRRVEIAFPEGRGPIRGNSRSVVVDWDRDGHIDLLLTYVNHHSDDGVYLCRGPLAGRDKLVAEPLDLIPGNPRVVHFAVADWDGDGRFDLLAGIFDETDPTFRGAREIVWLRNRSNGWPPVFDAPRPVLTMPDHWRIDGFAPWVTGPGQPVGLVVGVNGMPLGTDGNPVEPAPCQVWRYRRE